MRPFFFRVRSAEAFVVFLILLLACAARAQQYTDNILYQFGTGGNDGRNPRGSLTLSGSTFYGMTTGGGTNGEGTIFQIGVNGTGYLELHSFGGSTNDGSQPLADGLTLSGSSLYGMTYTGGTNNDGVIFQINTNGAGYSVVYQFGGVPAQGINPRGSLTAAGSTLYGMTTLGGKNGAGEIFQINTNGSGYTVLRDFGSSAEDGSMPYGSLTLSGSELYGLTFSGGLYNSGVIFKIGTDGTGYSVLHTFAGIAGGDGASSLGSLTLSGSTLYGMTELGGTNNSGVIFQINTNGTNYSILHQFGGPPDDGGNPFRDLTLYGSTLYGMTTEGGSNYDGVVFEMNTNGANYAVVYQFEGPPKDGADPRGDLTQVGSLMYGMAYAGGREGDGVIFDISVAVPFFHWGNWPELWHGTGPILWQIAGGQAGDTVEITVSSNGVTYLDQLGSLLLAFIYWDTTTVPDGSYIVTATLRNSSGQTIGQYWRNAAVNNSATYYSGAITSNETWGAGSVNVVMGNVIIPSGVTVTLAPGAIVKSIGGMSITVEAGGTFDASGATGALPIVLTSLNDDSVGGDTAENNGSIGAEAGDWAGVVTVGGQFLENQFVALRYVVLTLGGTLTGSQSIPATFLCVVKQPVLVTNGVTLTFDPGDVIKFAHGASITVQAGGALVAKGTAAQPIRFTSINDDSIGGIADGSSGTPKAGDWESIYIEGGTAVFDHVAVSYGASVNSPTGLITSSDPRSVVTISDSIFREGLYDGIQDASGKVMVTNCIVVECDRGIQVGLMGGAFAQIVNCTLDYNNYGIFFHGGTASVANTIVAHSLQGGIADCCSSVITSFKYNDVWAENGFNYKNSSFPFTDETGQNGNISADPNFIDGVAGDFQLNYLSPCIDAADTLIGPATDIVGDPRYNDPRTLVKKGIPNAGRVYADIGAYEFVETAPSDVDLVPLTVSGATAVQAGSSAIVTWTVINKGFGPAIGPWHDTLSLKPLDGGNPFTVATVLVEANATLGPGQTYTNSVKVRIPGAPQGNYLWQVTVNSQDDIYEGENLTNNTTAAAIATSLSLPTLTVGGSLTRQFTGLGEGDLYEISPGAGQNLHISLQALVSGAAVELFIGHGYVPSVSQFDYKSSQFDTNNASLTVPNTSGGNYYVLAYAASLASPSTTYTISASVVTQFVVNTVSPATITANGSVTLQLTGGLLAGNDTYQLVGAGGSFAATAVVVPNSTSAFITFNLAGSPGGNYSLVVTQPDGATITNLNAVQASSVAAMPQFSVQIDVPSVFRVGRSFDGEISYENIGNADMPAPILILSSGGGAALKLFPTDLYSSNNLELIAAAMDGPAGVLSPGQTYDIPFSAEPLSTHDTILFTIDYKTAIATDLVDYAALGAQVRPPGYTDAAWNVLWANFQTTAGPTWGGLVQLVDNYATTMAEQPNTGAFYSLPDVLAFAFADVLAQAQTSVSGSLYLGDTNHPLAQTGLYLYPANASDTPNVAAPSGVAQSFVDGTFRFLSLAGGTYSVSVPGYWLPEPVFVTAPETGSVTGVNIIVSQGASLQGVVYDQFGVLFLTNVQIQAYSTTTSNIFDTTTGTDGSYLLGGLPPDTYALLVGGGLYVTQEVSALTLSNGQTLATNFFLAPAASLEGQVSGNGVSLTNAAVVLLDASSNLFFGGTDTNGNFDVSGLVAGLYTITVEAPGFAPYNSSVNLNSGQTTGLGNIALEVGATLTISLDSMGRGAITNGILGLEQNGVLLEQVYANSNGFATFTDLAPGAYVVEGLAYGFQLVSNTVVVASGASLTNTYTLAVLGSIVGSVKDGSGKAISNMNVNLFGTNGSGQDISFSVVSDANGNYALLGLPPGTFLLTVGNAYGIAAKEATIVSNEQATVNFTLGGSVIQGQVMAADGITPEPFATVTLTLSNQTVATANTDTNGMYVFRVLTPGDFSVAAGSPAGLTEVEALNVSANANVAALPLTFGGLQFGGIVTDETGQPLANASVVLLPSLGSVAPQILVAVTATNGVFTISGLVAGQYTASVKADGFSRSISEVDLTTNVSSDFMLTPGLSVTGLITNAAGGLPVANAVVSFFAADTHLISGLGTTDPTGAFTAADMSAGNYDVIISESGYQIAELPNVAVNANSLKVSGALTVANKLAHGLITDTSGIPIANAQISFVDTNTGETLLQVTTGDDGSWATAQLPAGTCAASASALGYLSPVPTLVTVSSSGASDSGTIALTPVATDDQFITIYPTDFTSFLSQALGSGLTQLFTIGQGLAPNCSSSQFGPGSRVICSDCNGHEWVPVSDELDAATLRAWQLVNQACAYWQEQWAGGTQATGASAGKASISLAKLASDFAAIGKLKALQPELQSFSQLDAVQQKAALGLQFVKDGADATLIIETYSYNLQKFSDAAASGDASKTLQALFSFIASPSLSGFSDISKTIDFLSQLQGNPAVFNSIPWLSPLKDGLTLALDAYKTYKDYKNSLGTIQGAKADYLEKQAAFDSAMALWTSLNQCPNMPPCPPPVPPQPIVGPAVVIAPGSAQDPNDKLTTGVGPAGFVRAGAPIFFTVLFENEAKATLPAQQVVITDQLDPRLNWGTLQLSAIGFNNVTIPTPFGVQTFSTNNVHVATDPNPVQVTASLNPTNGVITWVIESINPLTGQLVTDPRAGFLPPDKANGVGEGYVTYSVNSLADAPNGAIIHNQANIVFDANAPILTPITTNTIDSVGPQSSVTPLPSGETSAQFSVKWSGTDPGGPGVAMYTIFVSTNGGPYTAWLVGVTYTSATFVGQLPNTYSFYSEAIDKLGNIEIPSGQAEAQTTIVPPGFPIIVHAPTNLNLTIGQRAAFHVVAQGKAPLKYQWKNGAGNLANKAGKISGATTATLVISPSAETDSGSYSVSVANELGSVTSSNAELQVVSNIFLAGRGTYNGLFAPTNAPREQTNSGSFRLSLTTTGVLSGNLFLGAQTVPLHGKFSMAGAAQVQSVRRGQSPLTTSLQLDITNQMVTGTVSDGSFVAALVGDQSVFSRTQKATAFEGQYTLIIPGASKPTVGPFGVSYGTLTVSPLGAVTLGGSLADGTAINQATVVSKDGYWPFYLNLYGGKGSLWGWNFFTNHTITNAGGLSWINSTNLSRTALYRSGFTNSSATLSGEFYVPAFELPTELTATLEGGNLRSTITAGVTVSASDAISLTNKVDETNKLALRIQRGTGVITGSFANPAEPRQTITVHGVLLQGSTNAQGYFRDTNKSGIFTLQPSE